MEKTTLVFKGEKGRRLDVFLAEELPEHSRSFYQKLAANGKITVNGQAARQGQRLTAGDEIELTAEKPVNEEIRAVEMPLDIVYEDSDILVINKPSGMTVHPAAGHHDDTLVNALLAYSRDIASVGDEDRPGIVHRLDKDTSGLLCAAKTERAHKALQQQLADRTMHRRYLAIVLGNPDFNEAVIDAPIGRSPADRQKQAVIADTDKYTARNAVTHVKILERFGWFALVECVLETGRTHQIRVHMSYIKHPVLGDALYGGVKRKTPFPATKQQEKQFAVLMSVLKGQLLHAAGLSFAHPISGEPCEFSADIPGEFRAMLDFLRQEFRDIK